MTYNFYSPCKHMHLSFRILCNKEHRGVISNIPSSSNSYQSTCLLQDECLGKNYSSFIDFTCNYERTSGIFVPWNYIFSKMILVQTVSSMLLRFCAPIFSVFIGVMLPFWIINQARTNLVMDPYSRNGICFEPVKCCTCLWHI